jgi:Spy/CpxP family protein refolding chaperone
MGRSKVIGLLLTASLALNLAFLAAFVYREIRHHRLPAPPMEFRGDFGLKADQQAKVRDIVRKFKINSILFKEDILDKRVAIIEELGTPLCDPEKIAKMTEELNQLENQLNRDFIAALLKINDLLEPEQRLNMIYGLSRNWFFFDHRPEKGGPHE